MFPLLKNDNFHSTSELNIRMKPEDVDELPKIPAQPIGYEDAKRFLEKMGGPPSPQSWRGKIAGVEYRLGGEMLVCSQI